MDERIRELAEQARQECMQLGSTAGTTISWCELERFAELVRQDEREACAKICDDWFNSLASEPEMAKIAAEIRARGNT